ncbi:MAG: hypothetical protein Q9180_007116, partial [Flavoplaca navasiana]
DWFVYCIFRVLAAFYSNCWIQQNGATTTYQIRCSDTEECGFPGPFTYIKDGTSSIQYAVGIQGFTATVECSVEGTVSATCTASGDVPPEETGAPAQPMDMTTTLSADEITYTKIPIVGAAVAPPTGLSATATSNSLSNEPISQTRSTSSQSSPSDDQANTTGNTAGAISLDRSSMRALVGAAALAAVLQSANMTSGMQLTDRAQKALGDAHELCQQYQHSQLLPLHLAVTLLDPPLDESKDQQQKVNASHASSAQPLFRQVIERAHGDPQLLDRALKKALVRLPSQDPPPDHVSLSPQFSKVLRSATELQKTQKDSFVAVDHLIEALAQDSAIQRCLADANIPNTKLIDNAVLQIRGTKRVDSKTADAEQDNENLKKFTIDMTSLAREGKIDPVIGREDEIRRVVRILSRRTKNNPVLIGEPGVGKTTVVEGLASRIVNADVPANLAACKLLSLDVGSLVAGSKYRGEFEERMKG